MLCKRFSPRASRERDRRANVLELFRQALGEQQFSSVFGVEFVELHETRGQGVHGNAILTRGRVLRSGCVAHTPICDWPTFGRSWWLNEPRLGNRCFVFADIDFGAFVLRAYSLHLENLCGIVGRVTQLADVARHALLEGDTRFDTSKCHVVFGGDLNTLVHGIARFVPLFPGDALRFSRSTLNKSEATFFRTNVFADSGTRTWHDLVSAKVRCAIEKLQQLDLIDPFDTENDTTRDNLLYAGKLDWILFPRKNVRLLSSSIEDRGLSDHKCLCATLQF